MTKKRARRVFDAAFKIEAVRRLQERRAQKVPVTEIARDLDVRPDMLRTWARRLRQSAGQAPTDVFPGAVVARRRVSPSHLIGRPDVAPPRTSGTGRQTVNPQWCMAATEATAARHKRQRHNGTAVLIASW